MIRVRDKQEVQGVSLPSQVSGVCLSQNAGSWEVVGGLLYD